MGQVCSELQVNPRTFLRVVFMNVVDAAIPIKTKSFPEFVLEFLTAGEGWGGERNGKEDVTFGQETEAERSVGLLKTW